MDGRSLPSLLPTRPPLDGVKKEGRWTTVLIITNNMTCITGFHRHFQGGEAEIVLQPDIRSYILPWNLHTVQKRTSQINTSFKISNDSSQLISNLRQNGRSR